MKTYQVKVTGAERGVTLPGFQELDGLEFEALAFVIAEWIGDEVPGMACTILRKKLEATGWW